MKTHGVHVPAPHPAAPVPRRPPKGGDKAGCGCGGDCGCERPECCGLECLVRPRFFCGQLLTDQDLGALVGWAQSRFALDRWIDGWGVVCGLDVSCHGRGAEVAVGPGYAVDCCGRDVVVCEPAVLDLSPACRRPEEPCADLAGAGPRHVTGKGEGEEPRRVLVDVALRHAEEASDAQTALARGSCGQVSACEATRVREGHALTWTPAEPGSSPVEAAWRRWLRAWSCCCEVIDRFGDRFGDDRERLVEDDVRRWLVRWIDENPPAQLCFLRDWICRRDGEGALLERLPAILFLLVQDCRNRVASCGCPPCPSDAAVPLARVCLAAGGRREPCRVVSIDPYPPFRRPLSRDCWPAPLGHVNLARALWQRPGEACRLLADLGVRVGEGRDPRPLPDDLATLGELCRQPPPLAACGEEICLLSVDGLDEICLEGPRVIGFVPCPRPPEPPAEEPQPVVLDPAKGGPERVASAEGGFEYRLGVTCVNPNPFPVQLVGEDVLPEPLAFAGESTGVAVAEGRTVRWKLEVPASAEAFRSAWSLAVKVPAVRAPLTVENRLAVRASARGRILGEAETGPVRTTLVPPRSPQPTPEPPRPEPPRPEPPRPEPPRPEPPRPEPPRPEPPRPQPPRPEPPRPEPPRPEPPRPEPPRPEPLPPLEPIPSPRPRPPVRPLDDLSVLRGIGEARRRTLDGAGIRSFADFAATPAERLLELFPGVGRSAVERWIAEARQRAGGSR